MASDGNLSPDGRHMAFVSKDLDLINTFKMCLGLHNKTAIKRSGYAKDKKKIYYVVQFGNVKLYNFLTDIGLSRNKSKTIGALLVPPAYLADFLRGLIDGDGSIGYFIHPESNRKQFRIRITSASKPFLDWLKKRLTLRLGVRGSLEKVTRAYQLNYYKGDSKKIVEYIYYNDNVPCLKRKYDRAQMMIVRE